MKNYLSGLGLAVGILLLASNANAKSWRVNSNPNMKPHFTSINEAVKSMEVQNGDTLYIEPGSIITGESKIDKKIVVLGPGYWLEKNNIQAFVSSEIKINDVSPNITGVILKGLSISNIGGSSSVEVENCKINGYVRVTEGSIIRGCYLTGYVVADTNCKMENCIMKTAFNKVYGMFGDYPITFGNSGIITNNTIIVDLQSPEWGPIISAFSCVITNNIIINTHDGYSTNDEVIRPYSNNTLDFDIAKNNTILNNILSTTENFKSLNHPNNQYIGATEAMLFKMEGSDDAKYQLNDDSPAIGTGTGGGNCGAFGGLYPYIVSGVPVGTPYIYEAVISDHPVDGKVSVKLKAKIHNEK